MSKCGACGKFLSGGAACCKCKAIYHRSCVGLSTNQNITKWLCPCCVACITKRDNTNTPIRGNANTSEESPSTYEDSQESLMDKSELIIKELRELRNDMSGLRTEFSSFRDEVRDEIKQLRNMYTLSHSKIESLSERLAAQEAKMTALQGTTTTSENCSTKLQDLQIAVNDMEQLSLNNDLEISGITENPGENVMHITGVILSKIGVSVDQRDIVEVYRVGPARREREDGAQQQPYAPRPPRPIVLRVSRRAVRDQILSSARARRTLTSTDMEIAGAARRIYINERLTKVTRLLFSQARSLCKQQKWQFCWTRDGKILVREAPGKPIFRVRQEDDFRKLFK